MPTINLKPEVAVKRTIEELIETATTYDTNSLDRIYHDDLQVMMIDTSGKLDHVNKEQFKSLFAAKRKAGDPPMNTWADYHHVQADEQKAHVLLSRKNDLSGKEQTLVLSIDLVFESERWQVIREVIFLRPS